MAAQAAASVFRKGLLQGKSAVVTGGGSGIGFAIATELLQLGCSVVISSRQEERLAEAAQKLRLVADTANMDGGAPRPEVSHVACNIRSEDEVDDMMAEAVRRHGAVDFLCNNGGGQFPSAARNISANGWRAVVDTNLNGTFHCCNAAFRHSMEAHGGSIVNIIADFRNGFPGMAHTGAARAGVENLTKTLAVEWAGAGVRVNAVSPGIIYSDSAAANYPDPNFLTSMSTIIPAQRLGTVAEVSAAVCFLFGPGASYVTGHNMCIDGGSSLRGSPWRVPEHRKFPVYGAEDDTVEKLTVSQDYDQPTPFEQLSLAEAQRVAGSK